MVLEGARTIVSAGNVPLLVQAQSGQGLIYYLAYDPALDPICSLARSNSSLEKSGYPFAWSAAFT